jgi:hypothetical protein
MSTKAIDRKRAEAADEAVKYVQDDWTMTVCAACLRVSCWHGLFYCDNYKTAGTKEITVGEARKLCLESPTHWTRDDAIVLRLLAAGVYA